MNTGHDKLHITVMLTARANGKKLRPMVLLNRKRPDKKVSDRFRALHLTWAGTCWMNDTLVAEYLENVIGFSLFGAKRLLVWDAFKAHRSEKTMALLKNLHLDTAIVPAGCTKYVQV